MKILLRSSWQTVNIGDIAHTPGVLALLEKHLPEAELRLWPSDTGNGVREMLMNRFPRLTIVQNSDDINRAFDQCDFLLHGSGAGLIATEHLDEWQKQTGKPYGIFGISISHADDRKKEILNNASFVYLRDSVSLQIIEELGIACPVMAFGPDGAFAVDLRNDDAAFSFMRENKLEEGHFLCCIPRYRYTPYWLIKDMPLDERRDQRNQEMKEHDHVPLRDAITAIARETSMKVLICPEDRSQMQLGKEMLYDLLPHDVRKRVVWRKTYWLTDEAVSVYRRSAGLFGLEMHSPIMCIGNGIPALVCRFKEQTSKGFMWKDIGLNDWLFDMDNTSDVARIVPTVLSLINDRAAAGERVHKAREKVKQLHTAMVNQIKTVLT